MNVTIRMATAKDFPAVWALIKEFALFQKSADKVTITPGQMLEEQDCFRCLVAATEAGAVVGFASFFRAYYSWTGKALYLDDLYVREAYRQQGLGKRLLEAVIDRARQEGCHKVRWQVSGWNTEAIAFYQKMGATVDATELNCDFPLK